jgi:iron-sulfur cluster repair protein YtfE (RIC family)
MKTERLYKLTKKGEKMLEQLQYNNNKHVQLAEKILFPAIKPINKGDDNELSR